MTKRCTGCQQQKEPSEFCKDSKSKDKLQSRCKQCKSNWIMAYYKRPEMREKVNEYQRPIKLRGYYKHKVSRNISRRIRQSIKKDKNNSKWQEVVGYSLERLKAHLEKQFSDEMTWDNYGTVWHIDHVKPISSFDITDVSCDDFKQCWSLENLQPLFWLENLKKSNKQLVY